jgi:murein DD-endopeptidase MepM/ murein hydrolase activator NlpD
MIPKVVSNMAFPFKNPVDCRVTCIYGKKGSWSSGKHDGVDIVSDGDKTVLAVSAGKVIRAGWNDSWGYYVVVTMADGRSIVYAHMAKGSLKVSVGDIVKVGQAIGTMGNTGHSTGAHLHIELQKSYYKSGAVDDIIKFLGIENKSGKVKLIEMETNEVEKIKRTFYLPNGKKYITDVINVDGSDYAKVRPLWEAAGNTVTYDAKTKETTIK